MVSNEEIRRRLDQKRRGIKPKARPKTGQYQSVKDETTCPSCGKENPTSAKFCVGCGAELPKQEEKQEESDNACPSCGFENPENAKFCVKCGETLQKAPVSEPAPDIETKKEEAAQVPSEEIKTPEDYKICPSCHNKNPVNAKFCVVCGHTFNDDELEKTETSETEISPESEEADIIPESEELGAIESPAPELEELDTIESPEHDIPVESDTSIESKEELEEIQKEEAKMEHASEDDIDPMERIKKAKELLDMGAITQEEFDEIKKKYLDEI